MSHNKFLYGENRFNPQEILKFRIQAKLFDEKVTGYIQKFLKKYRRHWDRKIQEDANETDHNYASQFTEHFRLQIKLLIAIHILSTYNEKLIGREHLFHYLR